MPKYKAYNYKQSSMVVINFEEQIQPGTFEYTLHHLINDKLDLSIFDPDYCNDTEQGGRPAYDPAILLKIILYTYSKGITSSREIQWCCKTNILFKALSCDTVPHFTTVAHFVSTHAEQIAMLFEQIILVCDEQGLLGHELFAIDGCKTPSNASKEWSGTHKELIAKKEKIKRQVRHFVNEHRKLDKQDPTNEAQGKRNRQAIKTLNQVHERIETFLKQSSPRMGQGRIQKEVKSNITDNESAKMTTSKGTIQGYNGIAAVDNKHQVIIDAQAFGEGQEHHTLKPVLESIQACYRRLKINRDIYRSGMVVTADTGFANEANMQYLYENKINGYIPDNQFRSRDPKFAKQKAKYGKRNQGIVKRKKQVIPASEFQFDPVSQSCVCPAGNQLSHRGQRDDEYGNTKVFFEGRLLQCRHCEKKTRCMHKPESANHRKGNGRQVSFILARKRHSHYTDWMKHRVDSAQGKQIYSQRMAVVEPVFANIGTNKGLSRFSLRGKQKVQAQW